MDVVNILSDFSKIIGCLLDLTSHAVIRGRESVQTVRNGPKWFVFEPSCYAFGGRSVASQVTVNKVNIVYCIVLIIVASCSFRCKHWIMLTLHLSAWRNLVTNGRQLIN